MTASNVLVQHRAVKTGTYGIFSYMKTAKYDCRFLLMMYACLKRHSITNSSSVLTYFQKCSQFWC